MRRTPAMDDQALRLLRQAVERIGGVHASIGWTMSQENQTLSHPSVSGAWKTPRFGIHRVAPSRYDIESAVLHAAASQALEPRNERRIDIIHVRTLPANVTDRLLLLLKPYRSHDPAVAVISDADGAWLHIPGWDIIGSRDDAPQSPSISKRASPHWRSTDPGQWALKLLMLGPLRQNLWWQSPTHWDGLIISGTQLAQIAGMPTSTAYAVLQDLDRMGWIAHRRGLAVRLTRPEHVCADWLLLARRQTTTRLPIRPIFPSKNANEDPLQTMARLAGRLPHKSWAIGGWAACRLFNLDIVTEAERFPILIRTQGNAQDAMEAMECSICEPAQAIAYLEPAAGRHALAGSRMCGNIPIVDVIQAALDVASDSSRGVQQAEHIADLVAHHYQKAMASVSV